MRTSRPITHGRRKAQGSPARSSSLGSRNTWRKPHATRSRPKANRRVKPFLTQQPVGGKRAAVLPSSLSLKPRSALGSWKRPREGALPTRGSRQTPAVCSCTPCAHRPPCPGALRPPHTACNQVFSGQSQRGKTTYTVETVTYRAMKTLTVGKYEHCSLPSLSMFASEALF